MTASKFYVLRLVQFSIVTQTSSVLLLSFIFFMFTFSPLESTVHQENPRNASKEKVNAQSLRALSY